MPLTIEDIRNPKRKSGFDHVGHRGDYREGRTNPNPWGAVDGRRASNGKGSRWFGPRRATPEQAAQDYCDYMNGLLNTPGITARVKLNSAGHQRPQRPQRPQRRKTRKRGRRRSANQDRRGYVYCYGEKGSLFAVKVGKTRLGRHPIIRMAEAQTGNPRPFVMLGFLTVDDYAARERELHLKYINLNEGRVGEWFRPTAELLSEFNVSMQQFRLAVMTGKGVPS